MQQHLLWAVFVAYFSFFNKCEAKPTNQLQGQNGVPYILSELFENQNKQPVILYLEAKHNMRAIEDPPVDLREMQYDNEWEEDDDERYLRTSQSDERAYLLYHLLRTTIDEENIDPAAVPQLEYTKEFLRKAFAGRCRKLNTCVRQCPQPTAKYTCTVQCKQIFDDLDECNKPKENKCGVSECGHTMPPAWLL